MRGQVLSFRKNSPLSSRLAKQASSQSPVRNADLMLPEILVKSGEISPIGSRKSKRRKKEESPSIRFTKRVD